MWLFVANLIYLWFYAQTKYILFEQDCVLSKKNILMELTKNLVIIVISLWTRCFIGKKIQENTLTDMSPLSSGWMPPFMILIKWQNNTICSHIVDDIYYIAPLHIFRKVRREAANYHTCFLINYGRLVN